MSRTYDAAFFPCPICDKSPHVSTYDGHFGKVWCKGGILSRHKEICGITQYMPNDKLYKYMSSWWNQQYYTEIRRLPILGRIENEQEQE